MSRDLHGKVLDALGDRNVWEQKQRVWYEMRHSGLKRRNKPFPGAADLHFPLIDTTIDKFKPFYLNAAFGTQQLASFTPLSDALQEAQAAAEECFDWKTRNETNFEEELDMAFDAMLMSGRVPMKIRWDNEEKRVDYECVNPLFFVVPKSTHDLKKAPWLCHVKQLSLTEYKLEPLYNQDEEFIKRIRGSADNRADSAGMEQEKASREGLTYSNNPDEIILWETWVRDAQGWVVHTFAPSTPDAPVRAPFRCPYRLGKKPILPFVSYQFEVKDRGWYAPRGVAERLAPFETYATKNWNAKADFMEFATKPLFTSENALSNTGNARFRPGDCLPPGVSPVALPTPPMALDQEIANTRLIAQESIQVPDFGVSDEGQGQTKTATEMNYVASFTGQGVQYRGRISFRSLAETYRISWALWIQYGGKELAYVASESRKVLPMQANLDQFMVAPNGSPDQWNRQQRLQRAVSRYQMFRGHPNVNQEELVKCILEEDDPRLVKRLFISTNSKSANEAEDEAMEIVLLMNGFPAAVNPGEDHQLRIRLIAGKLQQLSMTGAPVDPVAKQRLQEHMVQHVMMLKQENPAMGKQFMGAISALEPSSAAPDAGMGPARPGTDSGSMMPGAVDALQPQPEAMAV